MKGTFTHPSGVRFRCASQRRFVLVVLGVDGKVHIIKRSDSLDTIRKAAYGYDRQRRAIVDTHTGEAVQS